MTIHPAEIAASSSTVEVSIIDTTTYIQNIPAEICLTPVIPGLEKWNGPSYTFLIYHQPSNTRLLFDLGVPKDDTKTLTPGLVQALREEHGLTWTVEKDVSEILTEHHVSPSSISAVIYSHHHWDHVGDITAFPTSTELLVGPGFKAEYLPGWPEDPENISLRSVIFEGRKSSEVDFSGAHVCEVGGFQALDYFHDGSFYILNTPGHTTGHISALARTTPTTGNKEDDDKDQSTFIFMGGDITHHCLNFRPSELKPLRREITPNPYSPATTSTTDQDIRHLPQNSRRPPSCPSEMFTRLHRLRDPDSTSSAVTNNSATGPASTSLPLSHTNPFCLAHGDDFPTMSQQSTDNLLRFDGMDNVLTVFAHDDSLRDVVEFFPKKANDWRSQGWGGVGHWRFLRDLVRETASD